MIKNTLHSIQVAGETIELYVPDAKAIEELYSEDKTNAYWAQVWPAAIGMCCFLKDNLSYIKDKSVTELAAGLGLTGFFAADYAKNVLITEKEPAAIDCVQKTIKEHGLPCVKARVLEWKDAATLNADVFLLSDVNYDPSQFDQLEQVLFQLIEKGSTVILSTPQRLIAKDFINRLLPYSHQQCEETVEMQQAATMVTIFVLKKKDS